MRWGVPTGYRKEYGRYNIYAMKGREWHFSAAGTARSLFRLSACFLVCFVWSFLVGVVSGKKLMRTYFLCSGKPFKKSCYAIVMFLCEFYFSYSVRAFVYFVKDIYQKNFIFIIPRDSFQHSHYIRI